MAQQGSGLVKQKILTNTGPRGTIGTVSADGYRWIGRTNDSTTLKPPLDSAWRCTTRKGMRPDQPVTVYYGPAKWRVRKSVDTDAGVLCDRQPTLSRRLSKNSNQAKPSERG